MRRSESRRWLQASLVGVALVVLGGCGSDTGGTPAGTTDTAGPTDVDQSWLEGLPQIVEPGKEDNFRAPKAQEYTIEGETTVTIEPELAEADEETKLARVRELIRLKQVVIGWFLNAYLVEKSDHNANEEYGGFKALTKNGSYEDLDIRPVDGSITYSFRFRQEVGGQNDLLGAMGLAAGDDGSATFDLTIGKISNTEMAQLETNGEWYRKAPWSAFNPSEVDPNRLEQVTLRVAPQPRSEDAWIDYAALFADGLVTVGVHWGWDYHKEYHLVHAEAVFDWLVREGYEAPVASFAELTHESGPLVRTISANGQELRVEISLYTGKPETATDPDTDAGGALLETMMRESFSSREVVVYSGHSGPFYGFALANWRKTDEGDLDDSEIAGLEMPAETYQVVLAEGCDTFALGQAFWGNPAKPGRAFLDVITTTSFSNASTPAAVKDFLTAIAGTDSDGAHEPQRYGQLLKDLDGNSYWFSTMYGVHGIDDNPHLHPYADVTALCRPCQSPSDCGAGMQCTRLGEDSAACTAECTADDGCPAGYRCENTAEGYWVTTRHCVPDREGRVCDPPEPPQPTPVRVVVNEVLAGPDTDATLGDANGDGNRDAAEDEFVELVSLATEEVDLSGWTLSDGLELRFTFPDGTVLEEGRGVVVFGGGDLTALGAELPGVLLFAAPSGLGLTNDSDVVTLADADGEIVDRVLWGPEGGRGVSLVRNPELDPDAALTPHATGPWSPGKTSAGASY